MTTGSVPQSAGGGDNEDNNLILGLQEITHQNDLGDSAGHSQTQNAASEDLLEDIDVFHLELRELSRQTAIKMKHGPVLKVAAVEAAPALQVIGKQAIQDPAVQVLGEQAKEKRMKMKVHLILKSYEKAKIAAKKTYFCLQRK